MTMHYKISKIQYICPDCQKDFQGYTKSQVWFQYSMHAYTMRPAKEEELIKLCQKKLGISDEELFTPRQKIIFQSILDKVFKGEL